MNHLRCDMLRAAGRTRERRPETAGRIAAYLRAAALPAGGFPDRAGGADLYYTVFGMQGLTAADPGALAAAASEADAGPATVVSRTRAYLESFGDGAGLDFVHTCCLVRCRALLEDEQRCRTPLSHLETYRAADGGYSHMAGADHGTAYAAFLALGAFQDGEAPVPQPHRLAAAVRSLRAREGGYANSPGAETGGVPATAAAVLALAGLGQPDDADTLEWLRGQRRPEGGWPAAPAAPAADLLSTATAVHALAVAGDSLGGADRAACLAFVESLAADDGGFRGHPADAGTDCEYTFYGLLALGHLA